MINGLGSAKPYELQCVSQTLDLFDVLSRTSGMLTLSHLSRCVGISKNKMFRLLATLEQHGVVEKFGEGWYRFGGMAFALARRIIVSESIMDHARPTMVELSGKFNESVYLATIENGSALLRDMVDCNQAIRAVSFVGTTFTFQHNDEVESLTKLNLTNYPGLSVDAGGLDAEVTTVSALIRDSKKSTCGALVVLAPSFRMSFDRIRSEIAPELYSAAAQLSGVLSIPHDGGMNAQITGRVDNINRTFEKIGYVQPLNYPQTGIYSQQQM